MNKEHKILNNFLFTTKCKVPTLTFQTLFEGKNYLVINTWVGIRVNFHLIFRKIICAPMSEIKLKSLRRQVLNLLRKLQLEISEPCECLWMRLHFEVHVYSIVVVQSAKLMHYFVHVVRISLKTWYNTK